MELCPRSPFLQLRSFAQRSTSLQLPLFAQNQLPSWSIVQQRQLYATSIQRRRCLLHLRPSWNTFLQPPAFCASPSLVVIVFLQLPLCMLHQICRGVHVAPPDDIVVEFIAPATAVSWYAPAFSLSLSFLSLSFSLSLTFQTNLALCL